MLLSGFDKYIIAINLIGFVLFAVNTWLYTFTEDKAIDQLVTVAALLGGSLGIVVSIAAFDRKAEKDNMLSRVFVFCMLIIQIIAFLVIKGYHGENLTFSIGRFFGRHKFLIWYLAIINLVTFTMFAIDKIRALEHGNRIRIVTLFSMAFAGGSVGGLAAMYIFRHKTSQIYFTVGVPMIIVMQTVLIFYVMNLS